MYVRFPALSNHEVVDVLVTLFRMLNPSLKPTWQNRVSGIFAETVFFHVEQDVRHAPLLLAFQIPEISRIIHELAARASESEHIHGHGAAADHANGDRRDEEGDLCDLSASVHSDWTEAVSGYKNESASRV
ncbi:hypothetical protein PG997_005646 [Apiospora hydei]|uniref:Uncharacterized protein n=1 Tax=Apiospora hydei TaxID=1337664 RepID=A0ABR1WLI6_9PEZI